MFVLLGNVFIILIAHLTTVVVWYCIVWLGLLDCYFVAITIYAIGVVIAIGYEFGLGVYVVTAGLLAGK